MIDVLYQDSFRYILFLYNIAFDDLTLPCYLEEGVLINVTLRWSQFQQDGQLIWRAFDYQFYRDCTSNITKAATATTGLHKLHSYLPLFDDKMLLFHRGR